MRSAHDLLCDNDRVEKLSSRGFGRRRGRPDAQSGAAAVEFALVLPIFLAVLFGMIDFGWYYYQRFTLAAAVRDGIRFGVTVAVSQDPWTTGQLRAKSDLALPGSPINSATPTWGPSTGKISTMAGQPIPNQFLTLSATMPFTPLVGFVPFLPTTMSYSMSMLLEVQ
jgi:Flp pilus assembly protein TadG